MAHEKIWLRRPIARRQLAHAVLCAGVVIGTQGTPALVDLERLDVLTGVERLRDLVGDALHARWASS
jgi:hypothetical protein